MITATLTVHVNGYETGRSIDYFKVLLTYMFAAHINFTCCVIKVMRCIT